MRSGEVEELVTGVAGPIAEKRGIELVDVEYVKEGGEWYLRLYVDRPGGVFIEDCAELSQDVGRALDRLDPIAENYILEVSSSGEKPLRKDNDFVRFAGRRVLVTTQVKIDDRKSFEGELLGLEDGKVIVNTDGVVHKLPRENIAKARLVVEI